MTKRLLLLLLPFAVSCDILAEKADEIAECADVCSRVDECGAEPPPVSFGSFTEGSGVEALDCAANCVQDDRALYGYSDCQIECLQNAPCGQIQDCWKAKSDTYAEYCLADREIPPVEPDPEDPEPENGSKSGSEKADDLLEDPSSEVAVDESDFDVNFGDNPPDITGLYRVKGNIDESANARPPGSVIDTTVCFWGQESLASGAETSYCEYNVPGDASAPVTGSGDEFTIFLEYPGAATLLFSGRVGQDGTIAEAETLVVYTHAVDVWEHSVTDWEHQGECDVCE